MSYTETKAYIVRYKSFQGIQTKNFIAKDQDQANEIAKNLTKGSQILNVVQDKPSVFDGFPLDRAQRYTFLNQLATLLRAKMGPVDALRLIADNYGGQIKKVANDLTGLVDSGMNLADAIHVNKRNFPGAVSDLILASADGGDTPRSLMEAAEFERKLSESKKGSFKAILSLFFFVAISSLLSWGSGWYIGPLMSENGMFQAAEETSLPQLISVSQVAFYVFLSMFISMAVFGLTITVGRLFAPVLVDLFIRKIPVASYILTAQERYVSLFRLSMLFKAGMSAEKVFSSLVEGSRKGIMQKDFIKARENILNGDPWQDAMSSFSPIDRAALKMTGDTSQLAKNLEMMADSSQQLYINKLDVVSPIATVVGNLCVATSTGILAMITTIPTLQLTSNLGL